MKTQDLEQPPMDSEQLTGHLEKIKHMVMENLFC